MPRWFKLYTVALVLWAFWAVGRIEARHAQIPAEQRAAVVVTWQTLAP